MKSSTSKQRHAAVMAKKIVSHNKSQDEARQGRKVKRTLHDFRDIPAQQLLSNSALYDLS